MHLYALNKLYLNFKHEYKNDKTFVAIKNQAK